MPIYGTACAGFVGTSLGCVFAPNISTLLALRALQGAAGQTWRGGLVTAGQGSSRGRLGGGGKGQGRAIAGHLRAGQRGGRGTEGRARSSRSDGGGAGQRESEQQQVRRDRARGRAGQGSSSSTSAVTRQGAGQRGN